jgi:hypothetical protein
MRRLLTVLITFVVVSVAADFGLRFLSQYWVAGQVQRSLDLPSRPSVTLNVFPFIPRLLSGDVSEATIRTGTFTVEGVRLERVRITLRGVHFSTRQLLYGSQADITAGSGAGVAVIKAVTVSNTPVGPIHIRFEGGQAILTSDRLPDPISADVAVDGSVLVFNASDPALPGSLDVDLPKFVAGLRYSEVTVTGSKADISFAVANPRFRVTA